MASTVPLPYIDDTRVSALPYCSANPPTRREPSCPPARIRSTPNCTFQLSTSWRSPVVDAEGSSWLAEPSTRLHTPLRPTSAGS
ncbi:Uncharacterised protein [Bordetella pertussis]|nr:Uncharacterised protein [Bordetella pertussis]CFP60035.1 Uncharacterised protein [Bordetella pertussis]